jgi:hypothetical protein
MMTNASQKDPMGMSVGTMSATALIVVGATFQLAVLGYAHMHGDGLWFFSVLGSNIWNMLALAFNAPATQQLMEYWPLALVGAGFAILLAKQQGRRRPVGKRVGDIDGGR